MKTENEYSQMDVIMEMDELTNDFDFIRALSTSYPENTVMR